MKKLFLIFALFSVIPVFGQRINHRFYFSEVHVFPSDSSNLVYFSYRIPYDRFIFTKNNDHYTAKFRITIEVFDTNSKHITRQIEERKLTVNKFEQTNSNLLFFQDIIKIKLPDGTYKFLPIITDLNTDQELRQHNIIVKCNSPKSSQFLSPIIIDSGKTGCNKSEYETLTNYNNNIPFSENKFDLIIPVTDTTINKIFCTIIDDKDTVFSKAVTVHSIASLNFDTCKSNIVLTSSVKGNTTNNFVIKDFSNKLKEGRALVLLSFIKNKKPEQRYNLEVTWFDKPFSLNNPENAIRILEIIDKRQLVDKMLSESSKKYPKVLYNYWKKFDPTPETKFNPLMDEFYTRVDYAAKNFASISKKNGITTDRGKIYIKYGKPEKIERTSNQYGQVVEAWIYSKPDLRFVFIDKDGTGDFILSKG